MEGRYNHRRHEPNVFSKDARPDKSQTPFTDPRPLLLSCPGQRLRRSEFTDRAQFAFQIGIAIKYARRQRDSAASDRERMRTEPLVLRD